MTQPQNTRGPDALICQSCGMPLASAADSGTEAGGSLSGTYCRHCYQEGAFTSAVSSADEMAEVIARGMGTSTPEGEAREQLVGMLSNLERWRSG